MIVWEMMLICPLWSARLNRPDLLNKVIKSTKHDRYNHSSLLNFLLRICRSEVTDQMLIVFSWPSLNKHRFHISIKDVLEVVIAHRTLDIVWNHHSAVTYSATTDTSWEAFVTNLDWRFRYSKSSFILLWWIASILNTRDKQHQLEWKDCVGSSRKPATSGLLFLEWIVSVYTMFLGNLRETRWEYDSNANR